MLMRRHLVLLVILGAASAVAVALLVSGLSHATAERADFEAGTQGGSDPGVAIILSDARDGAIDGTWSCPSMRYVAGRVPVLVYSKPLASLRDATGRTCNSALKKLQPGASPSRVISVLGTAGQGARMLALSVANRCRSLGRRCTHLLRPSTRFTDPEAATPLVTQSRTEVAGLRQCSRMSPSSSRSRSSVSRKSSCPRSPFRQ